MPALDYINMPFMMKDVSIAFVMLELFWADYHRWRYRGKRPHYYWLAWALVCRQCWRVFKQHELYFRTMFHACSSVGALNRQLHAYQSTRFNELQFAFRMDRNVPYGENLCEFLKDVSPRIDMFELSHNKIPYAGIYGTKLDFPKASLMYISNATMDENIFPTTANLVMLTLTHCTFHWTLDNLLDVVESSFQLKIIELGLMVYIGPPNPMTSTIRSVKLKSLQFLNINLAPELHLDVLKCLLLEDSEHALHRLKISQFHFEDLMLETTVNQCKTLLRFTDEPVTLLLDYRENRIVQGSNSFRTLTNQNVLRELNQHNRTLAAGSVGKLWYQFFQPQIMQIVFSDEDQMHHPLNDMSKIRVIAIVFPFNGRSEEFKLLTTVMEDYCSVKELVLLITENCTREHMREFWQSCPTRGNHRDTSELMYISICDSGGKGMVDICQQEQPEDLAWFPVTVYSDIEVCPIMTVLMYAVY